MSLRIQRKGEDSRRHQQHHLLLFLLSKPKEGEYGREAVWS